MSEALPAAWRRLAALLLLLTVAAPMAACSGPPQTVGPPVLGFDRLPPLAFDVARVETEIAYQPPGTPPHVEQLMPMAPSQAAAIWARDRLTAVGDQRRLRFVIREAPVVEAPLPIEGGVEGVFRVQQSFIYKASMVIEAEIVEESGFVASQAKVTAERSVTLREDADAVERDRTWNQLVKELMADVDVQLEATLSEVFRAYRR